MSLNVLDLFCGTGAFSYGFEAAGLDFVTRLGIDLLPLSIQTFQANHKSSLSLAGDIRRMRRSEVAEKLKLSRGEVDVIVGGPPCQGFSSIRPFRSCKEDDQRNSLFEEFASFVNFFRPRAFVLENVVGLATYASGSTLGRMTDCFHALGYETNWKILNAAHFGVPQKRERLIMIGAERGGKIRFPATTHHLDIPTIGHKERHRTHCARPNLFDLEPTTSPALSVQDAISDLPILVSGASANQYGRPSSNSYQSERRKNSEKLLLHESTAHTPKMLEIIRHSGKNISALPAGMVKSGFSSCYSRLDANQPAVTITVNFVHPASNRCIHPTQDRALTPREGARLQSFDDSFVFSGNRSQVVKQIGNAVPPVLGNAIARAVREML